MLNWMKVLGSGCAVYLLVAACGAVSESPKEFAGGAGSGGDAGQSDAGDGGSGGSGGVPDAGHDASPDVVTDSMVDAVADAVTEPIPDAVADVISDHEVEGGGTSGSRLKLSYYAGEDGSKVPIIQVYDSDLQATCTYRTAADGSWRCMPSGYGASGYFSDASCSGVLFSVTDHPCLESPMFGLIADACGAGARMFELGAVHTGGVHAMVGGECVPLENPCVATGCQLHVPGAEVPPSRFVAGTVTGW